MTPKPQTNTLGCVHCSGKNDKPGWKGLYSDDGYIGYSKCWNCNIEPQASTPDEILNNKENK